MSIIRIPAIKKRLTGVAALLTYFGFAGGHVMPALANDDGRLMDHTSINVTHLGPWTVTWEQSHWGGGPFCRAVGKLPDDVEITILNYDSRNSNSRGEWFFSLTDRKLRVPEELMAAVEAAADGGPTLTGELLDVGDWTGGPRTAWYARFEFPKADSLISAIRDGKPVTIRGDAKLFEAFTLPIGADIIRELDRCIAKGRPAR